MVRSGFASIIIAFTCLANAQQTTSKPIAQPPSLNQQLIQAVQAGKVDQVASLIKQGANPKQGSPLFLLGGTADQQTAIAKLLVEGGANVKEISHGGLSTLQYAVSKTPAVPTLVRYFLAQGVDPNRTDYRGFTPLHSAVRGHEVELVKDLIEANANVNAKVKATSNGTTDITAQQFEPGYINAGQTPLMLLASNWNSEIVNLLIAAGANVRATDANGWNLLHYAAKAQNADVIPTILTYGVDINAASKQGFRPLHVASRGTSPAVIQALLSGNANPNLKNKSGQTPLDLLRSDSVRIIRGYQAKPGQSSQDPINTYLATANPVVHVLDPLASPITAPAPAAGSEGVKYAALEMNGVTVDRAVKVENGKTLLTLDFRNNKDLSGQNDATSLTLDGALLSFQDSTSNFPLRVDLKRGQSKRVVLEFPAQAGTSGELTLWYHDTDYPPVFGAGIVGEELVYTPIFQRHDTDQVQVHFALGQGQSVLHIDEVEVNGKKIDSLKDTEYTLTPSEKLIIPELNSTPIKSKCTIKYRYRLAENSTWHSGVREF